LGRGAKRLRDWPDGASRWFLRYLEPFEVAGASRQLLIQIAPYS
jgi:hypothetical protein